MEELVFMGGEVKALPDGKVEGCLVRFSGPEDPDITSKRDFFTKATDFGVESGDHCRVLYHHGATKEIGTKTIGDGVLEINDLGVFISAQLNLRDEYEEAIYGLAQKGKLGWSSGSAGHLVRREAVATKSGEISHFIKSWPLGLDASLTPTPAEPRNEVVAVKAVELAEAELKAALTEGERRRHATVTRDNDHSSTLFMAKDKAYLLPVPPGDKNAAKVALHEMYSYPLTQTERQSVHDRAAEVLGDEHDKSSCWMCDGQKSFAPAIPVSYDTTLLSQDANGEGTGLAYIKEMDMDANALSEQVTALTNEIKSLKTQVEDLAAKAAAPAPATTDATKTVDAPVDAATLSDTIKSAFAEAIAELKKPQPRIPQAPAPGAAAAVKTREDVVLGDDSAPSEARKAIEDELKSIETKQRELVAKREAGDKLSNMEVKSADDWFTRKQVLQSQLKRTA